MKAKDDAPPSEEHESGGKYADEENEQGSAQAQPSDRHEGRHFDEDVARESYSASSGIAEAQSETLVHEDDILAVPWPTQCASTAPLEAFQRLFPASAGARFCDRTGRA